MRWLVRRGMLVVDDDESNRALLCRMLRNLGLQPAQLATAADGLEAVETVLASMPHHAACAAAMLPPAPSLEPRPPAPARCHPQRLRSPPLQLLLRLQKRATRSPSGSWGPPGRHMPRLTGDGAIRRLRASGCTGFVAAVSGDSPEGERGDMLAAGANVVLPKPLTRHAVTTVLHDSSEFAASATLPQRRTFRVPTRVHWRQWHWHNLK
jgi:CheY-like chemotaxis protein